MRLKFVSDYARWYKSSYRDEEIARLTNEIKAQDSSYTPPEVKSGGCYVATAVYGSYDCPQVWTLRRYRDFALAETWHGRAFIHLYYACLLYTSTEQSGRAHFKDLNLNVVRVASELRAARFDRLFDVFSGCF